MHSVPSLFVSKLAPLYVSGTLLELNGKYLSTRCANAADVPSTGRRVGGRATIDGVRASSDRAVVVCR